MNKIIIPESFSTYILSTSWAIDLDYGFSYMAKVLYNQSVGFVPKQSAPFTIISGDGLIEASDLSSASSGDMVRLRYSGAMMTDDQACGQRGVQSLADNLYSAYNAKGVSGVLLELHSGGGEGLSAEILDEAIGDRNKPVVVRTHVLGSAAVKGTVKADEIIASNPQARIGSIGAFFSLNKEFVNWYKENIEDIYSELAPDKNSEFRQYFAGDKAPIQKLINSYDSDFKAHVQAHRNLKGSQKQINETLAGGMFKSEDAKQRGLIDGVGGLNYAIRRLNSHIKNRK